MKVSIPVWNSRVSPVFDTATRALIVTVKNSREVSRIKAPISDELIHRRANWLAQKGVSVLVCGAISRPLANLIVSSGIELIPWMAGDVEEIIEAFLKGKLLDRRFLMPGCCHRPRRFRRGPFRRGQRS